MRAFRALHLALALTPAIPQPNQGVVCIGGQRRRNADICSLELAERPLELFAPSTGVPSSCKGWASVKVRARPAYHVQSSIHWLRCAWGARARPAGWVWGS